MVNCHWCLVGITHPIERQMNSSAFVSGVDAVTSFHILRAWTVEQYGRCLFLVLNQEHLFDTIADDQLRPHHWMVNLELVVYND